MDEARERLAEVEAKLEALEVYIKRLTVPDRGIEIYNDSREEIQNERDRKPDRER